MTIIGAPKYTIFGIFGHIWEYLAHHNVMNRHGIMIDMVADDDEIKEKQVLSSRRSGGSFLLNFPCL